MASAAARTRAGRTRRVPFGRCCPLLAGGAGGVLVLGGSEGGLVEGFASALARHGFATMALAYFAMQGLPPKLIEIPVEYFRRALDWLRAQPETSPARPAVVGSSKGGEAALLVASTYDDVGAVVLATIRVGAEGPVRDAADVQLLATTEDEFALHAGAFACLDGRQHRGVEQQAHKDSSSA